jgi:FMN phosphatase YigB (HAD superfamily)
VNSATGAVFLFDVDNTLLDNDRIQADLRERLKAAHGERTCARYWEIFQEQWGVMGYADYFGALARLRLEEGHDRELPATANWLMDYPFADRLYPKALDAVEHVRPWGSVVILSDGDAVLQPRKIARSGLWKAFAGNVLIYVHKEKELEEVAHRYPAAHYVLIDDKTRILAAVKVAWGDRVTTIFPRQGHFAIQEPPRDGVSVDETIEKIGDLLNHDFSRLKSGSAGRARRGPSRTG